jgi:NDP-sugar pyrophosphorylase family protein
MDVFPALLENDVPFYSHEIEAYWNDVGNIDELRQANFDALHGAVEIESDLPEVGEGIRSASPLDGVEVEGPALIGSGVRIGAGARIQGPAIIGDGCEIGSGAWVRDAILLTGTELPAEGMLVGAIAGRVAKP